MTFLKYIWIFGKLQKTKQNRIPQKIGSDFLKVTWNCPPSGWSESGVFPLQALKLLETSSTTELLY